MKKFINGIIGIILCAILAASTLSVGAVQEGYYGYYSADKVTYMTDEEIFNEVWYEYYWSTFGYDGDPFMISIARNELVEFLKDYEPLNKDTSISDVESDFHEYGKEKYSDTTIEKTENGYVEFPNDNPDDKITYTYDEEKKMYIGTDESGKIEKTYDRYFPEEDKNVYVNSDNSTSSNTSSQAAGSGSTTTSSRQTEESSQNTQVQQSAEENNSTFQVIILTVIGILICIGIITIIIIKKKERKDSK